MAELVDSMLNEYIAQEINSTARMSISLRWGVLATAIAELLIVIVALLVRNRSVKATAESVRQPIERLEDVAAQIDKEVRSIIDDCYKKAKDIILEHEDILHKCAELLLEKEKIGREEFEALFGTN